MDSFKIKNWIFTDRSTISIVDYLKDINQYQVLTKEEESELFKQYNNGNQEAFNKIICSNLRFVVTVAKQFQNQGVDFCDLINEGNLGLIKAATRFDVSKDLKFISYAIWWIRLYMQLEIIRNSKIISVPIEEAHILKRISKFSSKYEKETGEKPTIDIISEQLDIKEDKLKEVLRNTFTASYLDNIINENGDTLNEIIPSNETYSKCDYNIMRESLVKDIDILLNKLTKQEKSIIELFYGLNNKPQSSLFEIADILNITPERVRQIKDIAIKKLRQMDELDNLKQYLG